MLRVFLFLFPVFGVLLFLSLVPEADAWVSGLFFSTEKAAFTFKDSVVLDGLSKGVFYGARILGVGFLLGWGVAALCKRSVLGLGAKGWGFLFLCLVIGPGLLANVVFKDHWGRARPRDTEVFGGAKPFTPAFVISDVCPRNCSFVSGDGAFGFFLPAFAYVVPTQRRRRLFWGMMGAGSVIAAARIILGAHFFSDVLAALLLVLGSSALLHALLYGRGETKRCWRDFLG